MLSNFSKESLMLLLELESRIQIFNVEWEDYEGQEKTMIHDKLNSVLRDIESAREFINDQKNTE